MVLADLGADVIKVESAGNGDPYRSFRGGFYSPHFQAYNRNKRALSLDLKTRADREVFQALVRTADVYIQNFRPAVAARLGAGFEDLSQENPRLVYCCISGFGASGPYVERPSYDSVTQALSGFLGVAIDPGAPRLLGPALADSITGLYAALGIMAALVERSTTGRGQLLEISMLEAMMHFSIEPFTSYFALGEDPTGLDRPRLAQAFIVRCADDRLIAIHLSSVEKFWSNLLDAVDDVALKSDPRFLARQGRIEHYPDLLEVLNGIFGRRKRSDWLRHLAQFDLPFAPVNSISEAANDPQASHLQMTVPVHNPLEGAPQALRAAFTMNGQRDEFVEAAPLIDQHGPEIRRALEQRLDSWPVARSRFGERALPLEPCADRDAQGDTRPKG
jgi:crotonobetainyl-CoA:carnitine CoA-transferase CaiB-like acyl-CoA transferase